MPNVSRELADIIRREIEAKGPISSARFMELALFHPVYGYYEQPFKQIGCQGDFYTSVSVGSLFGQLLAFQFSLWLEELLSPAGPVSGAGFLSPLSPSYFLNKTRSEDRFQLVEAGAHDGQLAVDILNWLQTHRPSLAAQVEYWIVEPSPRRSMSQREALEPFASQVRWFSAWGELPPYGVRGIIFSNELLDSFPVYRLGWSAATKTWFEWRIRSAENTFTWQRSATVDSAASAEMRGPFWAELPSELLDVLPDGFTIELCPAARQWWSSAACHLRQGTLLTFDYGLEGHELLMPQRHDGTLRGYRAHRQVSDALADPGQQDLTAHVNFDVIREAGEKAGLSTVYCGSQAGFLTGLMRQVVQNVAKFGTWGESETRQFHTLAHPEHMGHAFRALVQEKR